MAFFGNTATAQDANAAVHFWNSKLQEIPAITQYLNENYPIVFEKRENDLVGFAQGLSSLLWKLYDERAIYNEGRSQFFRTGHAQGIQIANQHLYDVSQPITHLEGILGPIQAEARAKLDANLKIIRELESNLVGKERLQYEREHLSLLKAFDEYIYYKRIVDTQESVNNWTSWKINHELEYCRAKFNALMGELRRIDGSNLRLAKTLNEELHALVTKAKEFGSRQL